MITLITFLCVLLSFAGLAGAHTEFLSPALGILVSGASAFLLAVLFALNFLSLALMRKPRVNWWAFLFGFFAFAGLAFLGFLAFKNPVTDISSDLVKPPKFLYPAFPFQVKQGGEFVDPALRLDREYEPGLASKQELYYPEIRGVGIKISQKPVYDETMKTIKAQFPDWNLVLEDVKTFHAEFVVTSPYLKNIDDVVIEVRADKVFAADSVVEIRSRSRIGVNDFGVNVSRVRDFKARLTMALKPLEEKTAVERVEAEKKKAEAEAAAAAAAAAPPPPPKPSALPTPLPKPMKKK